MARSLTQARFRRQRYLCTRLFSLANIFGMLGPLPPLHSLRSFEAVARQLSFSKAADKLHVTPSAVSQQIRALEELLGTRWFNSTRRSVALTDAAMLPDVQAGLESLARALSNKIALLRLQMPAAAATDVL